MARGRKPSAKEKDADLLEDEKHPLDVSSEESEVAVESEIAEMPNEEKPSAPAVEESKKISGSPLGKIRGKDLQWQK